MHSAPLFRRATRAAALAFSCSWAVACGGDPKPPPTPDPPQVALTVPEPNTAGPELRVLVTVSGCDQVTELSIYDRDTLLKGFGYGGGTAELKLASSDIKYTNGIAANLALNAHVTCADGRKNQSQPQSAIFFPAEKAVVDPGGEQVVTDFFTATGSGSTASFIGCGNETTGVGTLYRVDTAGAVKKSVAMAFACTAGTVVTERNSVSGKRWVWTPGSAAMAVDDNFVISAKTPPTFRTSSLTVMPNGDALVYSDSVNQLARISHTSTNGAVLWEYKPSGTMISEPVLRGEGVVQIAFLLQEAGTTLVNVTVDEIDNTGTNGGVANNVGRWSVESYFASSGSAAPNDPAAAFSADGATLYLAFPQANNQSIVLACAARANGCEGSNQRWASASLPAVVGYLLPYAGGSRVAAIGAQRAWFLDNQDGSIRNKDQKSVDADGALRILQVQLGRATGSEIYLLNGPAPSSPSQVSFPQEIVAVDTAEQGEVYRYSVASSLSASVDDSGRLWMRVGKNLVQTLPLTQYRQARK